MKINCYDGAGCIGGNKILLEADGTRLFLDFGTNFDSSGRYYEEYLQPKSVAGIYEPVLMGILPPFTDLYRSDLFWDQCNPWDTCPGEAVGDLDGILISHAHVDHIGCIHFLRPEIDLFCTPMTAAIIRAYQDTTNIGSDYCRFKQKILTPNGLIAPKKKDDIVEVWRQYLLNSRPSDELVSFWQTLAGDDVFSGKTLKEKMTCGGLNLKSWPVDHSIYGACAWGIETSQGWVIYSGDIRFHGQAGDASWKFVEEAAALKPYALIMEGTRIDSERNFTEDDVKQSVLKEVQACDGLVVGDFGPRNVERLTSFYEVAKQTGRKLAILPKDVYLLEAMQSVQSDFQSIPDLNDGTIVLYKEYSGSNFKWLASLFERYEHLTVTPTDIEHDQDRFICCFSFFDVGELAYLRPKPGSIWIYSSCEALNEEMEISAERLMDWLDRFDMRLVGNLTHGNGVHDPFHVSGHASGPDLIKAVRTINPQHLIPVHTLHAEIYLEQITNSEIHVPVKGQPILI